jgi:hypothetical protein
MVVFFTHAQRRILPVAADHLCMTSWMYLVAVLDRFSRYVLSWELDDTLQLPFALNAVKRALAQAKPVICNSD